MLSNADFSTLKLAFAYFSVTNTYLDSIEGNVWYLNISNKSELPSALKNLSVGIENWDQRHLSKVGSGKNATIYAAFAIGYHEIMYKGYKYLQQLGYIERIFSIVY